MTTPQAIIIATVIWAVVYVWANIAGGRHMMKRERLVWQLKREFETWDREERAKYPLWPSWKPTSEEPKP